MKIRKKYILAAVLVIAFAALVYNIVSTDYPAHIDAAANNRILVLGETHDLVDYSNEIFIANRTLAMKEISGDIYALSYDGLLIYSLQDKSLKIYDGDRNGMAGLSWNKGGVFSKIYGRPNIITKISHYDDFSPQEKENFDQLFSRNTNRGPIYVKPYYVPMYQPGLIDTKQLVYITFYLEGSLQGENFYVYGGNNFTRLDISSGAITQYYNDLLGWGMPSFEQIKKGIYGSQITFLSSPREFTPEELAVFRTLREGHLRNKFSMSEDERNKYLNVDITSL